MISPNDRKMLTLLLSPTVRRLALLGLALPLFASCASFSARSEKDSHSKPSHRLPPTANPDEGEVVLVMVELAPLPLS